MTQSTVSIRLPRRLGAVALFVATAIMAAGGPALAQSAAPAGAAVDWEILARLRQTVQIDSNRTLEAGDADLETRGVAGVDVVVNGRMKRTEFSIRTGLDGGISTSSASDNLNRIDPNILATAIYSGKTTTLTTSASFLARPTSTTEIEDSGNTQINATRFDASTSVGLAWQATPRDTLALTTTASIVDFSRSVGNLTPNRTIGVTSVWARQATATTRYSFSAGFRHFDSDGVSGQKSQLYSFQAGVNHRRTSRHTLGLSSGFSVTTSDTNAGASSTQLGFVGAASFDYELDDVRAGLQLSQSIEPSSSGNVNTVTTAVGDINYRINALQRLGFRISYLRRSDVDGGGDTLQILTLGPNYDYSLTKDTRLTLGYQFRVRDNDANSFVTGHRVLLTLAHDLTLLP